MGAALANAGWANPTYEICGLIKGSNCSKITTNLKGCTIEEYTSIDSNPFKEKKFDLIVWDMSTIKRPELSSHIKVLDGMLKKNGTLYIIASNLSFYENWLPIMKKEGIPDTVSDPDNIWEKEIYEPIKSFGFIPSKWVFFYSSSVSDESRKIAEQIKSNDILSEKIGVIFRRG
jgi:hypothetical protein